MQRSSRPYHPPRSARPALALRVNSRHQPRRDASGAALLKLWQAWSAQWNDVWRSRALSADLLAGLTVATVALPLNLALAVASGLPPSTGLVAGAIGGLVAAMFGGAPLQVTGPTAVVSTIVLGIVAKFGVAGVAATAVFTGIVLVVAGLLRLGRFIAWVPESVLAGFMTGIGLRLLDQQIPEVLGFDYRVFEIAQMMHRPHWLHDVSWLAAVCGLFVAFFVIAMQAYKRFPAAIVAIAGMTFVSQYLQWEVARVGNLPSRFPALSLPLLADEQWIDLLLAAAPVALLVAIESLLSARAVDRLKPGLRPHEPNLELIGQGLANAAVGFMQGMPVTGVIVRSSVNVQSGGRTRLAALFHAVFLGLAVLSLSKVLSRVPLSALAGLLCVVGWRLIEVRTFAELLRRHRLEAFAFAAAVAGTVSGHLLSGLVAGLALHALHRLLHRQSLADQQAQRIFEPSDDQAARGVRAVLPAEQAQARRPTRQELPAHHAWLPHLRSQSQVAASAFVHPTATLIGRVILGEHVHIASGATVRADEGTPFFIGDNTNIQDGVVIHALKQKWVLVGGEEWAVYIGRNVSVAHNALVHGPCYIGDDTFVGFKAVVHDAVIGSNCFIGIGAVVVGVEVPEGRFVPHGRVIDDQDKVDALPEVGAAQQHFNEDVVDVNRGLAVAYQSLARADHAAQHAVERRPAAWRIDWDPLSSQDNLRRF